MVMMIKHDTQVKFQAVDTLLLPFDTTKLRYQFIILYTMVDYRLYIAYVELPMVQISKHTKIHK